MGFFKKRTVDALGEKKRDMPEGLWTKCPSCNESLFEDALSKNLRVCTSCGYHFTIASGERIASMVDEGSFVEMDQGLDSVNALGFKGYLDKVKAYQQKTGLTEAVVTGRATIEGVPVLVAIMDFRFLGASMGSVVGEKITRAIEAATAERKPVLVFSASGGARMHEGILSLMQMAKTSGALARHAEARLPYISILTHPTTGGVT
jgi:acetyl-CoA carboxylase carboxyl transferase subunit beta